MSLKFNIFELSKTTKVITASIVWLILISISHYTVNFERSERTECQIGQKNHRFLHIGRSLSKWVYLNHTVRGFARGFLVASGD